MMNGRPVRNISLDDAVDAIARSLVDQHKTLVFERGLVDPATVTTTSPPKEAAPRQAAPSDADTVAVVGDRRSGAHQTQYEARQDVSVYQSLSRAQPFDRHDEYQDTGDVVGPQNDSETWREDSRSRVANNGMTQRERAAAQLRLKPPVSNFRGHPSQDAVADYRSAASRRAVEPNSENRSSFPPAGQQNKFGVGGAGDHSERDDQQPQQRRQQPTAAEGVDLSTSTNPVPTTGNKSVRQFAKSQEESDVELVHQQIGALLAKQKALRGPKSSPSANAAAEQDSQPERHGVGFENSAQVHRISQQTQARPWGSRTGEYGNTYNPYDDDNDDETVDTVERELDAIEELVRNKHVLR